MSQARFHISALTMMLFGLSALLDSGKGDDITLEEIKDHASEGDLIPFLYKATDEQFDMGYCKGSPEFCQWYLGKIKDLCEVMAGNERRKYGIENRGICLLIHTLPKSFSKARTYAWNIPDREGRRRARSMHYQPRHESEKSAFFLNLRSGLNSKPPTAANRPQLRRTLADF